MREFTNEEHEAGAMALDDMAEEHAQPKDKAEAIRIIERLVEMDDEMTKVDLSEGLAMWSDGTHTVTSLEVQALQIWARLVLTQLHLAPREVRGVITGFLTGVETDEQDALAHVLMLAKVTETEAGRVPISADPVRQ